MSAHHEKNLRSEARAFSETDENGHRSGGLCRLDMWEVPDRAPQWLRLDHRRLRRLSQ